MYNIFLIFCSIVFVNAIEPKFCKNCKYFKKSFFGSDEFAKCQAFPIISNNNDYLVTGIEKKQIIDYQYCSNARMFDSMCGQEGKKYEQK